jgi:biotin operon repressor
VRIQARKVCVWEAVRKLNPVGVRVDLQAGFGYTYRPYSVPLDA